MQGELISYNQIRQYQLILISFILLLSFYPTYLLGQEEQPEPIQKHEIKETINVDPNYHSHQGTTPLLSASWNGDTAVIKKLIEKGADVNHKDDSDVGSCFLNYLPNN